MLKGILIGIGLMAALVVAMGSYAFLDSQAAEGQGREFATGFLRELSEDWTVSSVETKIEPESLPLFRQAARNGAFDHMAVLGRFHQFDDFSLVRHSVTSGASFSEYRFRGRFASGSTTGEILIVSANNASHVKMIGFQNPQR